MNRKITAALAVLLFALGGTCPLLADTPSGRARVLCTTFPIYQVARNVVQGRDSIAVELMLPAQLGCPHDYALTPQDMRKLAKADVLVVNGLGLEEFLGAPVERANKDLTILDSSTGIKDTVDFSDASALPYEWAGAFDLVPGTYHWSFAKVDGEYADPAMKMVVLPAAGDDAIAITEERANRLFAAKGRQLKQGDDLAVGALCVVNFDTARKQTVFTFKPRKAARYVFFTEHLPFEFEADEHFLKDAAGKDVEPVAQDPEVKGGHGDGHAHEHHAHDSGANPHLFTSPRLVNELALNIAAGVSKLDPEGAAVYFRNAQAYGKRMNALATECSDLAGRLANKRIVQPHGIMDYIARDMGLEIIGTIRAHGEDPSAAEMRALVSAIREQKVGAIFAEPQYSDKVARTLSRETGVPFAVFDPVASGPEDAPLDYFETVMRANLKVLARVLGTR